MEELKRIKNQKKREILSKIALLREASGKEEMTLDDANLDNDFNPLQHDQMIAVNCNILVFSMWKIL